MSPHTPGTDLHFPKQWSIWKNTWSLDSCKYQSFTCACFCHSAPTGQLQPQQTQSLAVPAISATPHVRKEGCCTSAPPSSCTQALFVCSMNKNYKQSNTDLYLCIRAQNMVSLKQCDRNWKCLAHEGQQHMSPVRCQ